MQLRSLIVFLLVPVLAVGAIAADSQGFTVPLFPSPSYFRQVFARPQQYTLEAPGSLRDLVQNGKLTLSVKDVVRLVVQRNTSVWLARLDVQASEPAVLRAQSAFDPRFVGRFGTTRAVSPTFTELEGSTTLNQNATFNYEQQFESGTAYSFGFSGTKFASNNRFITINPSIRSSLNFGVSQPLMRNRGFFSQRAPLMIARINRQVSRSQFEQNLADILQQAQNQYWDVVQARENLAVLKNSLELAEKSYARDKRALELGALPPLDIFRSQAEVANRQVAMTNAEYQLKQQEDALRRIVAADLDPDVRMLPLDLTEAPAPPTLQNTVAADDAVAAALRARPELDMQRRRQAIDDVNIRLALNSLKPDLRLGGNYSSNGLGGNLLDNGVVIGRGGLSDALGQLFDFNNPTYGFSLSLTLPIRSRQAQAELATAEISRRRNMYQQRELEQQISLEVRNAVNRLEQAKANIAGATAALDLARKNREAEQRKYELGAVQIFFVLEAQQRASDAELQLLAANIAYRRAMVAVQRATGALLPDNNIVVDEAVAGTK